MFGNIFSVLPISNEINRSLFDYQIAGEVSIVARRSRTVSIVVESDARTIKEKMLIKDR